MIVLGIGFRSSASREALVDALAVVEEDRAVDLIATAAQKSSVLASAFPQREVRGVFVAGIETPTRSERVFEMFGTGSVAEAAALGGAGRGARLLQARCIIGNVTLALAEGEGIEE